MDCSGSRYTAGMGLSGEGGGGNLMRYHGVLKDLNCGIILERLVYLGVQWGILQHTLG